VVLSVVLFELLVVGSHVIAHPTRSLSKQPANKHVCVFLQSSIEQFLATFATVGGLRGRHYWKSKERSGVVLLLQSVGNDGRKVQSTIKKYIVNRGAILPVDKEIFD